MLFLLLPLAAAGAQVGEKAPMFRLRDLNGKETTIEELRRGGPLLLEFGSVFCGNCQEALRWLERLRRQGGRGVHVAAVNVDPPKTARAVRSVARGLKLGFPVLVDDRGAAEAYHVGRIPHLVLVDEHGVIRAVHVGPAADLAEALQLDTWAPREGK